MWVFASPSNPCPPISFCCQRQSLGRLCWASSNQLILYFAWRFCSHFIFIPHNFVLILYFFFVVVIFSSFHAYMSCSERVVRDRCGAQSADFTKDFLNRIADSLIKVEFIKKFYCNVHLLFSLFIHVNIVTDALHRVYRESVFWSDVLSWSFSRIGTSSSHTFVACRVDHGSSVDNLIIHVDHYELMMVTFLPHLNLVNCSEWIYVRIHIIYEIIH